ncbi:hypothetical protein, partial [Tetzosporium hominis]|uniref:hypothetical protein n=1 Tax=Tetzosporium hominis TaxID=2020506 RepID=UPI001A9C36E1
VDTCIIQEDFFLFKMSLRSRQECSSLHLGEGMKIFRRVILKDTAWITGDCGVSENLLIPWEKGISGSKT